ncbi:MAG: sugar phosphate isomerase/epimerase [Kiritimatiellaeota bacterium]|nr:sugar phosphate isomerase/epimerase [Kiritimatiellota bacterium]
MTFACSTWNFTEEIENGTQDLPSVVAEIAGLGFDAVEVMGYHLPSVDRSALRELRNHAEAHGVSICAVDARNLRLGAPWPEYRTEIATMELWALCAAELACPVVAVFLGGFDAPEQRPAQLARDHAALKECAEFAERRGVRIGVENHRIYLTKNANLDPPGQEIEDILTLLAHPDLAGIGTVPDTDNVFPRQYPNLTPAERRFTLDAFARLLPRAVHVHVKVKGIPGCEPEAQFPAEAVAGRLRDAGYDGAVSLELMKPALGPKRDVLAANLEVLRTACNR